MSRMHTRRSPPPLSCSCQTSAQVVGPYPEAKGWRIPSMHSFWSTGIGTSAAPAAAATDYRDGPTPLRRRCVGQRLQKTEYICPVRTRVTERERESNDCVTAESHTRHAWGYDACHAVYRVTERETERERDRMTPATQENHARVTQGLCCMSRGNE